MEPQKQTSSKQILTPLIISMVGIIFTALAIVTYHFILTRYCARRANAVSSSSEPTERSQKQIGLEKEVLKAIPIFNYSSQKTKLFRVDQTECSVCLVDLEEGDMVRLLPNCQHSFHLCCIDEWLASHSNCPVCRSPIKIMPVIMLQIEAEELVEQEDVINGGDCDNASVSRSGLKLQHCVSLVLLPTERTNPPLNHVLKRSLSMDYSHVSIKIHGDHQKDSSSSASSSSSSSSLLSSSCSSPSRAAFS